MAVTVDLIRRITVIGSTQGVDAAQRELEKLVGTQAKAAASGEAMAAGQATAGASAVSAARQFEQLERRIDPVARAQQQLSREQRIVATALNEGSITTEQAARATMLLGQRHAAAVPQIAAAGKAIGLNRYEVQNLGFQLNDAATMLLSGASPFQIMATQGGQVFQVLQGANGGVSGAVKDLGSRLLGLLTPARLVGGAVAAIAVTGYAAWSSWDDKIKALMISLNGVGRASGQTVDSLMRIAQSGAAAGRLSSGEAVGLTAQFAGAGLGGSTTSDLLGSTRQFSKAFGIDLTDAGSELAKAFADPTRGAQDLNKRFGFLSDGINESIRAQQESGNLESARQILQTAYNRALSETTSQTSIFRRALEDAGNRASNAWSWLGSAASRAIEPTTGQKIDTLEGQRRYIDPRNTRRTRALDNEIGALQERQILESGKAVTDALDKVANDLSMQAGDIVRQMLPQIGAGNQYQRQADLLQTTLGDPLATSKLGVSTAEAQKALEMLRTLAALQDPIARMREDSDLAIRSIMARSLAERAAVDAERARIEVLRQTGDATRSNLAAELARNQTLAEAARELRDMERDTRNQTETVGMRPFQKMIAEINQQARDQTERLSGGGGAIGTAAQQAIQPFKMSLDAGALAVTGFVASLAAGAARGVVSPYGGLPPAGSAPSLSSSNPVAAGLSSIERALLNAIASVESSGRYDVRYTPDGGTPFSDFSRHPGIFEPGPAGPSSAAGRYQFTQTTWNGMGGGDFSPANQDSRALQLAAQDYRTRTGHDLLSDLQSGGLTPNIMSALSPTWTGLRDNPGRAQSAFSSTMTGGAAPTGAGMDGNAALIEKNRQQRIYNGLINETSGPIREANDNIKAQNQLLEQQYQNMGKTTAERETANESLRLFTQLERQGINEAYVTAEYGAEAWAKIADRIRETATALGQLATKKETFQQLVQTMDGIRGAASGFMTTFASGMMNGKSAVEALREATKSLLNSLMQMATNQLIMGLFGKQGTPGGGVLGTALASMIGGAGGGAAGAPMQLHPSAIGNVFMGGRITPFAAGGVVHSPTMFPMANGTGLMGEAGPEAIMPLRRGSDGRLGVTVAAAANNNSARNQAAPAAPIINVHAAPGTEMKEARNSRDASGRQVIDLVMAEVQTRMARGDLDGSMKRYGRAPKGVAR